MRDLHCTLLTQRDLTSREVAQELLSTLIEAMDLRQDSATMSRSKAAGNLGLISRRFSMRGLFPAFFGRTVEELKGLCGSPISARQHTAMTWACSSSHFNLSAAAVLVSENA